MADNSKIEWCDSTWNPIRARAKEDMVIRGREVPAGKWGYHCERISPGCTHCYASTMNGRMLPAWGTGLDFSVLNREKVEIFLDEEESLKPLEWKKPRRIFVESMSDWCATFVTDEVRDKILAVEALCPQHAFLHLTKRAKECAEYFNTRTPGALGIQARVAFWIDKIIQRMGWSACLSADDLLEEWPLPNVHLGFSAESQQYFDERWSHMRRLAEVGWKVWVSAEPLLSAIDMRAALRLLAQVVVGGESGHGARPMDLAWVRDIVQQCKTAGVSCFVKQIGAFPVSVDIKVPNLERWRIVLNDRKGGDMSEWPEDLRVRQFPEVPNGPR
jgi:protein gp37